VSALRAYQSDAIGQVQHAFREGARSVCLQLPTGGGKTHTAAGGIIAPSVARGRRVVFIADLEEILVDTVGRLRADGLPAATILAGKAEDPTALVQVASQQTLTSWIERGLELPPCDRVILDECHGSAAATVTSLLQRLKDRGALLLGLTATPARGDGQPLDEFDALVCGPQPRELVHLGALVPCEVLSPAVGRRRGCAMDPVEAVLQHAHDRRAVIFAPTEAQARRIADELSERGQPALAVLGTTHKRLRREARALLLSGEVRHLVTAKALQKGFDAPTLDTCVLTSECTVTSYLQSIGRVLRPAPGKSSALVLDLRGAVYAHGLPLDDRSWSLSGAQGVTGCSGPPSLRRCRDCHAVFPPCARCPRCGSRSLIDPRPLRIQRAELVAQSGVPVAVRAQRHLEAAERAIARRKPSLTPPQIRFAAARSAPAWVREALSLSAPQEVSRAS
jgi:superfamily II DNA or RNA helicase